MKSVRILSALSFLLITATGCATICGGSVYHARVTTPNHPNAQISYKGSYLGTGSGIISIKRKDADKVIFTVREEGCPEQTFQYNTRTFRGWAFVGTIFTWTGVAGGVPLPWGVAVDLATGAIWKPNVLEAGVSKVDYKNFKYTLPYNGCGEGTPKIKDSLDVFYFTDGRVVRGTLLEQTADGNLKVQLSNGNMETYRMRELERMVRAEKKK